MSCLETDYVTFPPLVNGERIKLHRNQKFDMYLESSYASILDCTAHYGNNTFSSLTLR